MSEFVTQNEAIKTTGKSASTIKRLVREITQAVNHPQRSLIKPSVDEVVTLKSNKRPYRWTISVDLLNERFSNGQSEASEPVKDESSVGSQEQIVDVLQQQLQSKDDQLKALERQLDRKDEQISELNAHVRASSQLMHESNQLMGRLQNRFALSEAKKTSWIKKFLGQRKSTSVNG